MMSDLSTLARDYCGQCPCLVGYPYSPAYGRPYECLCMPDEALLRCYADGWPMTALTPAQRDVCLDEIAAVEGYTRAEYAHATDQDLARGVLGAWLDFCRDKGLL